MVTAGTVDLLRSRVAPETLFLVFQVRHDAVFLLLIKKMESDIRENEEVDDEPVVTFFCIPQVEEAERRISLPISKLPVAG